MFDSTFSEVDEEFSELSFIVHVLAKTKIQIIVKEHNFGNWLKS